MAVNLNLLKASKKLDKLIHLFKNEVTYQGTEKDIPEGSRYVVFSASLIDTLVTKLEDIKKVIGF